MDLSKLRLQNPQWESKEAFFEDPFLKELSRIKLVLKHPVEQKIITERNRLFILRGPRQIGKTTLLKRLLKSLLEKGIDPQRTFYFALDVGGVKDEEALFDVLLTYTEFAEENKDKPFFIFIDEATYTRDWAIGVKKAYDLGIIRNCFVLITGSSSLELQRGGERLPGRRGVFPHEADLEMGPLTFREFIQNLEPGIPLPSPEISPLPIYQSAEKLSYYSREMKSLIRKFLLTGGFPLSINEFIEREEISPAPYVTYLQALLGDLAKAGKREVYLKEIIYTIIQKKLEPLDPTLIARETSIRSHNTVSSYIDILENLFVLSTLYHARNLTDPRPSFKRRRKYYFTDPFLFHTLAAWAEGDINPFKFSRKILEGELGGKIIENIVGVHLVKKGKVLFWRGKQGEIDFIFSQKPVFLEVKYQPKIFSEDLKILKKVQGGLLISKETLTKQGNIYVVPLHLFLPLL